LESFQAIIKSFYLNYVNQARSISL